MYEYAAQVLDVYDGDTIHVEVDLGCDIDTRLTVRLAGINAPELAVKPAGPDARDFLAATLGAGAITLRTIKDRREKYGRYLGILILPDGTNVNDLMVSSGHAVVYMPVTA